MIRTTLFCLLLVSPIFSVGSFYKIRNFKKLVKKLPSSYTCQNGGKYILSNNRKTWVVAKEICESVGLSLAKVRSREEISEMKAAVEFFLGPNHVSWKTFDNRNWIWIGGNDLHLEGHWEWLDRTLVEDWDLPWIKKKGKDNMRHTGKLDGKNAMSFSRWGEFDDSYHNHVQRKRPFACQCPGT